MCTGLAPKTWCLIKFCTLALYLPHPSPRPAAMYNWDVISEKVREKRKRVVLMRAMKYEEAI